jgi:hypothetical protein
MRVVISPWEAATTSIRNSSLLRSRNDDGALVTASGRKRRAKTSRENGHNGINGESAELFEENEQGPVVVSFVSGRRSRHPSSSSSRKKAKNHDRHQNRLQGPQSENLQPVIVLTTSHKITVVGKSLVSSTESETVPLSTTDITSVPKVALHGWRESDRTQYETQLGVKSTAFIDGGDSHRFHRVEGPFDDTMPAVSAVYDVKKEVFYAVQQRNRKLVRWRSSSDGPPPEFHVPAHLRNNGSDSLDFAASVTFDNPVVSLALLTAAPDISRASFLYGSLSDGSLFIAESQESWDERSSTCPARWSHCLFPSPADASCIVNDGYRHIGSTALIPEVSRSESSATEGVSTSSKRKHESVDGGVAAKSFIVHFFQVFANVDSILLVRREIDLQSFSVEERTNTTERTISTNVNGRFVVPGKDAVVRHRLLRGPAFSADQAASLCVFEALFLGITESLLRGHILSLVFGCRRSDNQQESGADSIALLTPVDCRRFLASFNTDNGCMFGIPLEISSTTIEAGLVGSFLVATRTSEQQLRLYDVHRGALLQQHSLEDIVHGLSGGMDKVNVLSLVTDSKRSRLALVYSLNDRVSVAMSSVQVEEAPPGPSSVTTLADCLALVTETCFPTMSATRSRELPLAEEKVASSGNTTRTEFAHEIRHMVTKFIQYNATGKLNGFSLPHAYREACAGRILGNGSATKSTELVTKENLESESTGRSALLSRPLVQEISSLLVKALLGDRLGESARGEAGVILRDLIHSKMISAQDLFRSGVRKLLLKLNTGMDSASSYSSVELSFDVLKYCSDVSERQLVVMLQFVLLNVSPEAVSAWSLSSSKRRKRSKVLGGLLMLTSANGEESTDDTELLLALVVTFLKKAAAYNDVNESLLRCALLEYFSPPELDLICRVGIRSLTSFRENKTVVLRTVRWLSVLWDLCLSSPSDEHQLTSTPAMKRARRRVEEELTRTGKLVSLKALTEAKLSLSEASKNVLAVSEPPPAAPYQIERLFF